MAAALIVLAGALALAYQHLGPFAVYINGNPVYGFPLSLGAVAGLIAAGVLALFIMAGVGLLLFALFVLLGGAMLFLAAPFLWPLIAVAVIVYLLVAVRRRH
jgi:hypothetical protein